MKRARKIWLSIATLSVLVIAIILTATWIYTTRQLQELKRQTAYATPEEGAHALIARYYSGVRKAEIVHAGREIFDDLWFVEAHVWAASRSDGKEFSGGEYDKPGWFFLRLQNGWVFVAERDLPGIIAFGKWLSGLCE